MCISAISLTSITNQQCTYIFCLFTGRKQREVQRSASILLTYCFFVLHCSHFVFETFGLMKCLWLYIWPQAPISSLNYINYNVPSMFAYTEDSKHEVFDVQTTIISTPHNIASSRGFQRWGFDIERIRVIYENAECSDSWVRSGTLPLFKANLGSQTPAMIGDKIRFQALSN